MWENDAGLASSHEEVPKEPPEKPVSPEEAPEVHLYPCPAIEPDAGS